MYYMLIASCLSLLVFEIITQMGVNASIITLPAYFSTCFPICYFSKPLPEMFIPDMSQLQSLTQYRLQQIAAVL
jgi:hypothetical protein